MDNALDIFNAVLRDADHRSHKAVEAAPALDGIEKTPDGLALGGGQRAAGVKEGADIRHVYRDAVLPPAQRSVARSHTGCKFDRAPHGLPLPGIPKEAA